MYQNPVCAVTSKFNPNYGASVDSAGYVHVRSYNHGVSVDIDTLRALVEAFDAARFDTDERGS